MIGSSCSATKKVNDHQLKFFSKKIINYFSKNSKDTHITIWGLSFKPGTDDVRESVALKIISILSSRFKQINLYDPLATTNARMQLENLSNVRFCREKSQSINSKTKALIVCTEWKEFWTLDEIDLQNIKVIFDGRNIYSRSKIESYNIDYFGIGV